MAFRATNLRRVALAAGEKRVAYLAHAIANEAVILAPVDTGELQQSIRARRLDPSVWRVSAHAPHALHVEFGTQNGPAQPYLRPAVRKVLGKA